MSNLVQGIKSFFGIKPKEDCFDKFRETADRVSAKTELLLADRNEFAHSMHRMNGARRKKKASAK